MQLSDRVTGPFLVGLGALTAYGGWLLPPVPGQQVGPNVFPMLIGGALALCGVLIAFGIGHHFEEEAEADLAAVTTDIAPEPEQSFFYKLRALIPPALLVFYVVAVERIGFIPTAAIIAFIASIALGARLRLAIPVALLSPIAVHLVFYKLLRVPLAEGFLPMPW